MQSEPFSIAYVFLDSLLMQVVIILSTVLYVLKAQALERQDAEHCEEGYSRCWHGLKKIRPAEVPFLETGV